MKQDGLRVATALIFKSEKRDRSNYNFVRKCKYSDSNKIKV